jgi:hypothetical protein
MLRHVAWYKYTDVSEVLAASNIRAQHPRKVTFVLAAGEPKSHRPQSRF